MKATVILFVLGLGAVMGNGIQAQENLIPNGDLSQITENNTPKFWETRITEINQGKVVSNITDASSLKTMADFDLATDVDGHPHALHINYRSGEGRALWMWRIADSGKSFEPKARYKLSMNIKYALATPPTAKTGFFGNLNVWKATNGMENAVVIRILPTGNYLGYSKNPSSPPPQSTDWKEYSVVFTMPEDFSAVGGWVALVGAPGELWADNFRLIQVEASTPDGPYE